MFSQITDQIEQKTTGASLEEQYDGISPTLICNWCHLVVKLTANASGVIWWPNSQLMQLLTTSGNVNASDATWYPNLKPLQGVLNFLHMHGYANIDIVCHARTIGNVRRVNSRGRETCHEICRKILETELLYSRHISSSTSQSAHPIFSKLAHKGSPLSAS